MKLKVGLTYNYIITSNTRLTGWTAALIVPVLSQDIVASPSSSVLLFLYNSTVLENDTFHKGRYIHYLLLLEERKVADLGTGREHAGKTAEIWISSTHTV